MWYLETIIFSIAGMIAILSAILGIDRMIKIVMWNYLINSILLGLSNFIDLVTQRLQSQQIAEIPFLGDRETWVSSFLTSSKPTLLLTTYFLLLIFILRKVHIGIWSVQNDWIRWILTVLFIPSTVLSVLLSIATALFGHSILNLDTLQELALLVQDNQLLYQFALLTPLWFVLPWLFIILVAAFFLYEDKTYIVTDDPDEITITQNSHPSQSPILDHQV